MMSITEIVQTAGWRKFMAKLYGFGASVVLIGALFKLQHWSGASEMLIVGMSVEAIIFFFSAFEPVHEELDWSVVYPELAGVEEDPDEARERNRARREALGGGMPEHPQRDIRNTAPGTPVEHAADPGPEEPEDSPPSSADTRTPGTSGGGNGQPVGGGSMTKFNQMLENAEITPELFDQLGDGLKRFSETAQGLNNVANASLATDEYLNNVQAASESVNLLTESYSKSKEALNQSIDQLSNIYQASADSIQQSEQYTSSQMQQGGKYMGDKMKASGDNLASAYNEMSAQIQSNLTQGSSDFNAKLEDLNKNLAALNSAYELELKVSNDHTQTTKGLYEEMDQMLHELKDSMGETKKYKEEISKLNQNLAELNMVYGNMLSAVSVMSNS